MKILRVIPRLLLALNCHAAGAAVGVRFLPAERYAEIGDSVDARRELFYEKALLERWLTMRFGALRETT